MVGGGKVSVGIARPQLGTWEFCGPYHAGMMAATLEPSTHLGRSRQWVVPCEEATVTGSGLFHWQVSKDWGQKRLSEYEEEVN